MRSTIRLLLLIAIALTSIVPASAQQPLRWLIIVDDYHINFVNTGRMRTQLKSAVDALIQPGDSFAVQSTGPSRAALEWTSDRSALEMAVKQATGNALKLRDEFAIAQGQAPPDGRDAATAARMITILSQLGPAGRTGIVYVSNGVMKMPDGIRDAIARAGVPALVLDPRLTTSMPGELEDPVQWDAYWRASRESLRTIAETSGGVLLERQSDMKDAARRMREIVGR